MFRVYGPASSNLPLTSVVRLSSGLTGLLDVGHRFLVRNNLPATADDGAAAGPLVGFVQVPDAFGGGFVFYEEHAAYFAKTFDGPLQRRGEGIRMRDFDIGPRCILIRDERGNGRLLGLVDGKAVARAPANPFFLWGHPSGYMVVADAMAHEVYFVSATGAWRKLPIKDVGSAFVTDDDILLSDAKEPEPRVYHIGADGKLVPAKPDEGVDAVTLKGAQGMAAMSRMPETVTPQPATSPSAPAASAEGALLREGWIPTGRAEDEWIGVQADHVVLLRTTTSHIDPLGPVLPQGDGVCLPVNLSAAPRLVCVTLGTRVRVLRIDLDTGERTPEADVAVKKGVARQIGGAPGCYPATLFLTATCEGDAAGGLCVRTDKGDFTTFRLPPQASGPFYIFPGEVVSASSDPQGGFSLTRSHPGTRRH